MKSLLFLTTLAITAAASAAETSMPPQFLKGIAPSPDANLYAALPPGPEPSHAMLLMMGCIGLAARRRR